MNNIKAAVSVLIATAAFGAIASPLRIMPLGDSITEGFRSYPTGGYRGPLWTRLTGAGYAVDYVGSVADSQCTVPGFDGDHEGHGGWCVDAQSRGDQYGLKEHLNSWFAVIPAPDVVLLHVGTNDADNNPEAFQGIKTRYEALLDVIYAAHPNVHVVVSTVMWRNWSEYNRDCEALRAAIKTYLNDELPGLVAAQKAKGRKISLVDMNAAVPGGNENFNDNIHPNATGYALMADVWYDEIVRLFPNPSAFTPESYPTAADLVPSAEISKYTLVYDIELPATASGSARPSYTTDISDMIPQNGFSRIAYLMELAASSAGTPRYVWVSMDAFTDDAAKIGLPYRGCGFAWQQKVSNMLVYSNVGGFATGENISEGNVEIWPHSYNPGAGLGGLGSDSNGNVYDWDDVKTSDENYGSFQIHDWSHRTTLMAYNRFTNNSGTTDIGIGNRSTSHPDWTLAGGADAYSSRRLRVYVELKDGAIDPAAASVPAKIAENVGDLAKDFDLLYELEFPATHGTNGDGGLIHPANYKAAHLVDNRLLFASESFNRVAYYAELVDNAGNTNWCWTSFDAPTADLAMLSIPTNKNVAAKRLQTLIANLDVRSNVTGVKEVTGCQTGNIEFWGGSLMPDGSTQGLGITGATNKYDFDDYEVSDGFWGTMQVHNWGEKATLWSFNGFNRTDTNPNEFGIGNDPWSNRSNYSPDWIFSMNGNSYQSRKLYVMIRKGVTPAGLDSELRRAVASLSGTQICVEYSGDAPSGAAAPENFSLSGNTVTEASVNPRDSREILLALASPLAKDSSYTLTVTGLATRRNNAKFTQTLNVRTPSASLPACITAADVPELSSFKQLYEIDFAEKCDYGRKGADYTVDETRFRDFSGFKRIGYLLYLKGTDGVEQWIWTSMNAFTHDATKIGVPGEQRDNRWQCVVDGLFVAAGRSDSQTPNVRTGSIPHGNIEFFKGGYYPNAVLGLPGASDSKYDFDDRDESPSSGGDYCSMQVHDYLNGSTLWAANSLGRGPANGKSGFGIGSQSSGNPDWTTVENASSFAVRRLYIFTCTPGLTIIFK